MLRLAPLGRVACVDEPLVQQRFSANCITRDFARSERARGRIVEKHRDLLGRDPRSWPTTIISSPAASASSATSPAPAPPWPAPGRCARRNPRFWAMTAYLLLRSLLPAGKPAGQG